MNKKKPKPHITPEEFAQLVEFIQEPYTTMIYTAVFTGLRVSELIGLKWEDVHADALTVDERYCRGDWSVTKTVGSATTIGVDASVIARIHRLKTLEIEIAWGGRGAKKRIKLVRACGPSDLVFQSIRKGAHDGHLCAARSGGSVLGRGEDDGHGGGQNRNHQLTGTKWNVTG